jgi:hypothetical protein
MVKRRKQSNRKNRSGKGFCKKRPRPRKINASTAYETCSEQLSPFGGLLPLIKFIYLVGFREIFHFAYRPPSRDPKLGHYLKEKFPPYISDAQSLTDTSMKHIFLDIAIQNCGVKFDSFMIPNFLTV